MPIVAELQKQYTPEKLQEIGQRLFTEGKYAQALDFFSAVRDTTISLSIIIMTDFTPGYWCGHEAQSNPI